MNHKHENVMVLWSDDIVTRAKGMDIELTLDEANKLFPKVVHEMRKSETMMEGFWDCITFVLENYEADAKINRTSHQ